MGFASGGFGGATIGLMMGDFLWLLWSVMMTCVMMMSAKNVDYLCDKGEQNYGMWEDQHSSTLLLATHPVLGQ